MFQVKKTSQSKKVMRKLDKERRKKAKGIPIDDSDQPGEGSDLSTKPPSIGGVSASISGTDAISDRNEISGKNKIHTEIRTDDFVVRLLLSNNSKILPVTVVSGRLKSLHLKAGQSTRDHNHPH